MKALIKLLFVTFISTLTIQTYGQIALKAGLNLSTMHFKSDNLILSEDFSYNPGFHAEIALDLPFSDVFALETGIGVSTKGYKYNSSFDILGEKVESTSTLNTLYVDIPLNAKVMFGDDVKFYVAAGPYVGIGVLGESISEISAAGQTETDKTTIEWGSDENSDDFERLDYGARVAVGVVLQSFLIEASYKRGFANVLSDTSSESVANHNVLGVSIGYKFGGR